MVQKINSFFKNYYENRKRRKTYLRKKIFVTDQKWMRENAMRFPEQKSCSESKEVIFLCY